MLSMRMAFSVSLSLVRLLALHQKNTHKTSLLHIGFTPSNPIMSGRTICGHSFRWVPLLSFLSFCFAFVCVCAHFIPFHLIYLWLLLLLLFLWLVLSVVTRWSLSWSVSLSITHTHGNFSNVRHT